MQNWLHALVTQAHKWNVKTFRSWDRRSNRCRLLANGEEAIGFSRRDTIPGGDRDKVAISRRIIMSVR